MSSGFIVPLIEETFSVLVIVLEATLREDTTRLDGTFPAPVYATPLMDETLLRASDEIEETVRLAGTPPAPVYATPLIDETLLSASDEIEETVRLAGMLPAPT